MKPYVYLIAAGDAWARGEVGPIKIGLASNVERRLGELKTGNHQKLTVIGWLDDMHVHPQSVETQAHRLLRAQRLQGEWFNITPKEAFNALCGLVGFADFYVCEDFVRQLSPSITREMQDDLARDGECCLQVPDVLEDGYFDEWPEGDEELC